MFLFGQVLKKVSKYIQEQNEKIYAPQGLLLTDPIERGLRVVSFSVQIMRSKHLMAPSALARENFSPSRYLPWALLPEGTLSLQHDSFPQAVLVSGVLSVGAALVLVAVQHLVVIMGVG